MMDSEASALAPTRTRQKATSGSLHARWVAAEDQLLLHLLRSGDHPNWTDLASHFPGKTAQQVSERWSKVVDPALVKGSWTRHEDETIMDYVTQYGTKNWAKLADMLPGRIGKQCRERWRNHLDPDNNPAPWTAEEDTLLIELHDQYGNQWVKMATIMKGRSDNHIKNRWNSVLRRRDPVANAEHTTPQKRSRRKIETPDSIAHLPKPNLETIPTLDPVGAIPQLPAVGWTPLLNQLDSSSPMPIQKSPLAFGSPFLKSAQFSPWTGADFMKGLGRGSPLFSPQIGGSSEMSSFLRALDSADTHFK
jgi:hypothetical protein